MNTEFLKLVNAENHKSQLIAICATKCDIRSNENDFLECVKDCLEVNLGVKAVIRDVAKS